MADAFQPASPRPVYDPNRFYIASTDSKGHYRQTKLAIPPDIASRVADLVESSKGHYRSRQDFYRDAIVHRMQELADHPEIEATESFRQWVGELTARAIIETSREILKNRRETVDACKHLLYETGSSEEAKAAVRVYITALPNCAERDDLSKLV